MSPASLGTCWGESFSAKGKWCSVPKNHLLQPFVELSEWEGAVKLQLELHLLMTPNKHGKLLSSCTA
jgi:hypothetical protein